MTGKTSALLAVLFACAANMAWAQSDCCEFRFRYCNETVLKVTCNPADWCTCFGHQHIKVETNSCTLVCWSHEDFRRQESNCDRSVFYQTYDTIESCPWVIATEDLVHCRDGEPLKVHPEGNNCLEVESHNGGYLLHVGLNACDTKDLCDDAGLYEGKVKVCVTVIPHEDCGDVWSFNGGNY